MVFGHCYQPSQQDIIEKEGKQQTQLMLIYRKSLTIY